jgi:3-deoxy-D-manno-octulosonic acid kinase
VQVQTPGGYEAFRVGRTRGLARPEACEFAADAIRSHGSLFAWAAAYSTRGLAGRVPAHVMDAPRGPWVVRHYTRGGRIAALLGDRYLRLASPRPFRELLASDLARAAGIATPEVMVAAVSARGIFQRGDIATRFVADSATLADITFGGARRVESERMAAWEAAGRCVRDAAGKGLVHADLNLRNLLVAGDAASPSVLLLDLDRCRFTRTPGPEHLSAMVRRLHRSAGRFVERHAQPVDTELKAFDRGIHR